MKIEEKDDSQESEEEYKKIDEYVKKKVREDNIIKTPENKPKQNNSKEISNLEISAEITISDRKDLILRNELLKDDKKENKQIEGNISIQKENLNNNNNSSQANSLLNLKKDNIQSDHDFPGNNNHSTNNSVINDNQHGEMSCMNIIVGNTNKNKIEKEKKEENDSIRNKENHIYMEESLSPKKSSKKKNVKKMQKRSKSKKVYEAIDHHSIVESMASQIETPNHVKDVIFGEKIESQYERLKKVSPFGNFNTFKLFKMIIKNGEDLRQEQFATQLINEFYQIFQLEEVDIWLKPYEILSTGHNVGLIECVPNSVSLDQLKRKSKNINNLSQFYETYFGPTNSESKIE